MIKRIAMKRKNTMITKEQDVFVKKFSKINKISEGDVFRLAIDKLEKSNE